MNARAAILPAALNLCQLRGLQPYVPCGYGELDRHVDRATDELLRWLECYQVVAAMGMAGALAGRNDVDTSPPTA